VTGGSAPGPILDYSYRLAQYVELEESVTVSDDGGVWYWSLKPPRPLRSRVGSFGFRLEDDELDALRADADEALEEQQGEVEQQRNAVEIRARVRRDDRERTFLLSAEGGVSEPLASLRAIGDDLRKRAEAAPLGVVSVSWRTLEPSLRVGAPATLMFGFENVGVQPVDLLIQKENGFTVFAQVEDHWEPWWQSGANGGPGLVGSDARLLGGILTPATLEPGASGQALFAAALAPPEAGPRALGARVEGWMTLARPDGPDSFPQAPFRLETEPREFEIA
jgi:hypothetical protein